VIGSAATRPIAESRGTGSAGAKKASRGVSTCCVAASTAPVERSSALSAGVEQLSAAWASPVNPSIRCRIVSGVSPIVTSSITLTRSLISTAIRNRSRRIVSAW
jgi:hypothetical protein